MAGRDIVVVGGSAGAHRAFPRLADLLPESLPAAVFVALHYPGGFVFRESPPFRRGTIPVAYAEDGEGIRHGRIYVAPVDRNISIDRGRVRVEKSPKESFARPAVNVLFRSAAAAYGRRVIGVILSGLQEDGVAGLWEIKARGGIAIVQDPATTRFGGMPKAALDQVQVDYCVSVEEIPALLVSLVMEEPPSTPMQGPRAARLVIVEDERVVALNLRRLAKKLGYEVLASVATGEEALKAVEETLPDVVLMDIRLPGPLDGISAAEILSKKLQIPVVYVTGYADDATIERVKRTDPYGYILKPFRAREIHAAIQIALERRERELTGR